MNRAHSRHALHFTADHMRPSFAKASECTASRTHFTRARTREAPRIGVAQRRGRIALLAPAQPPATRRVTFVTDIGLARA
jgi:hypothetical protein